jgi:anti-anti-sigma regulatory factor
LRLRDSRVGGAETARDRHRTAIFPSQRDGMSDTYSMLPAGPTAICRFTVETDEHDGLIVAVVGDLDPASARVLLELVESSVGQPGSSRRIEVDLRRLRACSNSGVRALTACAELGARLREGLHFRVGIAPEVAEYLDDGSVTMNT